MNKKDTIIGLYIEKYKEDNYAVLSDILDFAELDNILAELGDAEKRGLIQNIIGGLEYLKLLITIRYMRLLYSSNNDD